MTHSFRYEARLHAAWRDLAATGDALRAELRVAPPATRPKALAAVARALQEPSGLRRLPLVNGRRGRSSANRVICSGRASEKGRSRSLTGSQTPAAIEASRRA